MLADLVDGLGESKLAELKTPHRFGESIGALASAIRAGDGDQAVEARRAPGASTSSGSTRTSRRSTCARWLCRRRAGLREAAILGNAEEALRTLDGHRLLCAHRRGPYGVRFWNHQTERWLAEETGEPIWSAWYAGRPVLVTANDYGLGLYNGDTGATVVRDGVLRAVIGRVGAARVRDESAVGRGHDARDDDPQKPGQPGRRGDGATAAGGFAAADAGACSTPLSRGRRRRFGMIGPEASVRVAVERRAIRASGTRAPIAARRLTRNSRDHPRSKRDITGDIRSPSHPPTTARPRRSRPKADDRLSCYPSADRTPV